MKNLDISDEAFTVWCGLRNIMTLDTMEYFVSFNLIAHSIFERVPNRYELSAIKKGYKELVDKEYIKELIEYSKTDHYVDLTALYYKKGDGYFSDLSMEEMHKIMNIDGNHNKYKLLRYFTAQVGSFNHSDDMHRYKGKIGGMALDYFANLIPITKPTCISFNELLEKNELLFVIRHKDFYQYTSENYTSEIREIPNTYSRWEDQEYAKMFSEDTHGYKYFEEQANVKTKEANRKRSLGQKLNRFMNGIEYDIETIKEMYEYAKERNESSRIFYESEKKKGYTPMEFYYDLTKFDKYLEDEYWGE